MISVFDVSVVFFFMCLCHSAFAESMEFSVIWVFLILKLILCV